MCGFVCLSAGTYANTIMNLRAGVHKFSKNIGGILKILGTAKSGVKQV